MALHDKEDQPGRQYQVSPKHLSVQRSRVVTESIGVSRVEGPLIPLRRGPSGVIDLALHKFDFFWS